MDCNDYDGNGINWTAAQNPTVQLTAQGMASMIDDLGRVAVPLKPNVFEHCHIKIDTKSQNSYE